MTAGGDCPRQTRYCLGVIFIKCTKRKKNHTTICPRRRGECRGLPLPTGAHDVRWNTVTTIIITPIIAIALLFITPTVRRAIAYSLLTSPGWARVPDPTYVHRSWVGKTVRERRCVGHHWKKTRTHRPAWRRGRPPRPGQTGRGRAGLVKPHHRPNLTGRPST